MAQTNVSSCVLSIVASFTSGLDVFRKFREARGSKKRRAKKNAPTDDEELRLARSLRQGPEDIGREYQRNMHSIGEAFALGDVAAQTSLAEILLKLNTGLVTIINQFLTKDKRDVRLDYQSLTNLSDRSRIDTCRTLRQLSRRMMQFRASSQLRPREGDRGHRSQVGSKASGNKSDKAKEANAKHTKVKGPMLARVVIADSAKPSQMAMVRPGMRKKKSSASSTSLSATTQSSASLPLSPQGSPPPAYTPKLPERPTSSTRSPTMPTSSRPRHRQSAAELGHNRAPSRPVAIPPSRSTPRLPAAIMEDEPLPLMPNSTPLLSYDVRRRKATPTYYSIESASTQLGEIPMHKWAEPYDFELAARLNEEAENNGWPLTNVENVQLRKRGGFFNLFRRRNT